MPDVPQRVLMLYLSTGGGHLSACKALAREIEPLLPSGSDLRIVDGIGPNGTIQRTLVENGYRTSTLQLKFLWPLLYETARTRAAMHLHTALMTSLGRRYVTALIRDYRPTLIVNIHFLMNRPLDSALRRDGNAVPVITVVTDPFTAHPFWFFWQRLPVVVFSAQARGIARRHLLHDKTCRQRLEATAAGDRAAGDPPVGHSPAAARGTRRRRRETALADLLIEHRPILNTRFEQTLAEPHRHRVRAELGIAPERFVVLLAGGGEGLPDGILFLSAVLAAAIDVHVIMVCGKNEDQLRAAKRLAKRRQADVTAVGFTDRMYEFMNIADAVVTKAGPATILEALMLRKPLIITRYLYGQERGNLDFVLQNHVGWFAPRPADVVRRLRRLVGEPELRAAVTQRAAALAVASGTAAIARFVVDWAVAAAPTVGGPTATVGGA